MAQVARAGFLISTYERGGWRKTLNDNEVIKVIGPNSVTS